MTDLTPMSAANSSGIAEEDKSVFRSGGRLKEYPPRPRIATARPRSAGEGREPEPMPQQPTTS